MADDNEVQPIIKRVKKGGHGGHHGGAWKVAFADFMTAMMAFFLVMWLVGQSDQVKQAVAAYFQDPGKYQRGGGEGVLKGGDKPISFESPSVSVVNTPNKREFVPTNEEQERFALLAKNILKQLENEPAFKRLKKNVKMNITSEGLRIVLNESADAPAFFEPGSAKLLQKSAVILGTIAKELGTLSNRVVIEGHTDSDLGTHSGRYSNWELSTDRANAARQLMDVSGLDEGQVIEVRGYADRFPMIEGMPNDPRNRRVTLLLLYEERARNYDQLEVGADLMQEIETGG
ncbi:OmpA family protein [candidate division GN15 bacterium]|nr:OmpA family protein [candidate division GN15 bacterium]